MATHTAQGGCTGTNSNLDEKGGEEQCVCVCALVHITVGIM